MNFDQVKPVIAYMASITFGGVSLLSMLQAATSIVGLLGVLLGAAGAYYTFRIQQRNWRNPPEK